MSAAVDLLNHAWEHDPLSSDRRRPCRLCGAFEVTHDDHLVNERDNARVRRRFPWAVERGGLSWHGDWWSADELADLLSGEDAGRVPVADVARLLSVLADVLPQRAAGGGG